MKGSEVSSSSSPIIKSIIATIPTSSDGNATKSQKPHFKPAQDDTKPPLQDPILRSDPIETEEAVLKLPPFPPKPTFHSKLT